MLLSYKRGQTGVVLRIKILDSTVTTGAGKTGLAFNTSGLIISTIANNEAAATTYTVAGSTIENITTLGTYAAPTALKCRFKEVDATNHKGVYELHLADARFAVTSAKALLISLSGATGMVETDVLVPLVDLDPYGVLAEPSGEPVFGTSTLQEGIAALLVPLTNKKTFNKSTGVATYRNNGDSGTLWTTTATDDGTTRTIGKAT